MAILIADSGSTKTDWVCFQPGSETPQIEVHTVGLNPFHVSDNEILSVFNHELLPQLGDTKIEAVYFYGSGVRPEVEGRMVGLIKQVFPAAHTVEAHSDLLGACRALCVAIKAASPASLEQVQTRVFTMVIRLFTTPPLWAISLAMRVVVPFLASIFCTTSIQVFSHRISKPLSSVKRACNCPKLSIRFIASHRPIVSLPRCQSSSIVTSTMRASANWCIPPSTTSAATTLPAMAVATFLCRLSAVSPGIIRSSSR